MRKPTLFTLFLVVFIDLIGFGLIMPLLPYFGRHYGASGAMVGWLFGSFSLMQFLFAPIWGRLSDRIGRRPIMTVSLAGSTASYLILAFSHQFWLILASRVLAGICAANISVANAYVADITTKENRSRGMGVIGAAFGLGFILGPVLAGVFGRSGHELPAFIAAGISGLSLVLAIFFLPESLSKKETAAAKKWDGYFHDWRYASSLPMITSLIAISFLTNLAFSKWETTFALFMQGDTYFGFGIEEVGLLLAYVGLLVAMLQGGLLGRLVKTLGEPVLLKAGLISVAAGLAVTPLCAKLWQIFVCLTAIGIGLGMLRPVLFGIGSILTPPNTQGLILGVLQGAGSLGRIVGPLLGGWLLDKNAALPFWTGTLVLLLALGLTPPSKAIVEAKASPNPLP
ncbi:MAG: MFS transporter [Verrucomicrobium sp.]|nr:MFS transporter [Verrucomicrobium sp.]